MTRGELWWADFGVPFGSEPGFYRPVLIIQNDDFNKSRINTIIVLPLTTNLVLEDAPGNVPLHKKESSLKKDSVILVSQVHAIDRKRLLEKTSKIRPEKMQEIEDGVLLALGIDSRFLQ